MAVPKEIREVKRPVNTVVEDSGNQKSIYRYRVRVRNGFKYIHGQNPQPHNGKVIGHIIDGKYVPKETQKEKEEADTSLSYGGAKLIHNLSKDIFSDLLDVFPANIANTIMAIASTKVLYPGAAGYRLAEKYSSSFVSVFHPGAAVSENSVTALYKTVGKDIGKRDAFYKMRMDRVEEEHHVVIDGTLKQNTSIVNDLSHFSYKAPIKGCKDISVVYAYDIEAHEPLCSEVYPGNFSDSNAFSSFVRANDIQKGIIVADRGFSAKRVKQELADRPNVHFLLPLKRNDIRIRNNKMLDFNESILTEKGVMACKKQQIKGGNYLYSFQDPHQFFAEYTGYLHRNLDIFGLEDIEKKRESFGAITFESDMDFSPREAYDCYALRWQIEMLFRAYKNDMQFAKTNVHSDYAVFGAEFVNLISSIITSRIVMLGKKSKVLYKTTYGHLIEDLNTAWRRAKGPINCTIGDRYWDHTTERVLELIKKLEINKDRDTIEHL